MVVRLEYPEKAYLPILVTSLPIINSTTCSPKTFFKLLEEVYVSDAIALEFKVTTEHVLKADSPILVTLLGIVTEVKREQPEKA